jgi:hypothetical protein
MASAKQENDFMSTVLNGSLLENAVEWIGNNLNPEDVYSESDLRSWAKDNMEPGEIYSINDMLESVRDAGFDPDDVFHPADLERWAIDNGWVKFF